MSKLRKRSAPVTSRGEGKPGRLTVRVQPGASRDALLGKVNDAWKIAIRAPAVEGRANRACLKYVAGLLGQPPSALEIVRGQSGRLKVIELEGLSAAEAETKLEVSLGKSKS